MRTEEESALIEKAKNGGNYALAQLLEQNYNMVYHFMLGLTLDSQQAADVTQDCMVKVIEKFALYDSDKSALSTWMIAMAKNIWINYCRKNKVIQKYAEEPETQTVNKSIDEMIENDQVLTAVKSMSDKTRMPVLLKHAAGYSYEEIALILKIPVGTVKSRIFNGLNALKKELEGYER